MDNQLLELTTSKTSAIIWAPKEIIKNDTYLALNYLTDGRFEQEELVKNNSKINLFITKQFDKPLYIGILKDLNKNSINEIIKLLPKDQAGEVIIISNNSSSTEYKALNSKYGNLNFIMK